MPQVGIGEGGVGLLYCSDGQKAQPSFFDQFLKVGICQNGGPVAAHLQRESQTDHGMDVARTADGGKQDVKTPMCHDGRLFR
jgi:hypothetical protein